MLENLDLRGRYEQLRQQQARADAREWFRERSLLDRLPVFDPAKEKPMQFARRLEEFCGIEPGAALEVNERQKVITPRIEWIGKPLRKGWLWGKIYGAQHNQRLDCLMRAILATDAAEHGVRFGFIGNGYFPEANNP